MPRCSGVQADRVVVGVGEGMMRICYRGNFSACDRHGVCFNTEAHIAGALRGLGHEVIEVQEDRVGWQDTEQLCDGAALFLWTCTHGYAHKWDQTEARAAVERLNAKLPTAAVHLDLFFGLNRASWVDTENWFKVGTVFTADGDHDAEFRAHGVNHHWLPPAVSRDECVLGTPRDEYKSDIAFVGSWQGGYHPEWQGRRELVSWLKRTYGDRCAFWPKGQAIRGRDLADLYASVKVVVGDSCFAATATNYTSDRPFETIGRGGFLIYPEIPYVKRELRDVCEFYDPRVLDGLGVLINHWTRPEQDERRRTIQKAGMEHVRANHSYHNRMQQMLTVMGLA